METLVLTGLVLGLTQVLKMTFGITSRYIPAVAIILSIVIVLGFALMKQIPFEWSFLENALIVGLGSVGLWSGVKNTVK